MWTLPIAWTTCLALRATFGAELQVGPKLVEWATDHRAKVDRALALRDVTEAESPGDEDLYGFQRAGTAFVEVFGRAMIWDDPGSGKTVQAIRSLRRMQAAGTTVFPALVVCPNSMKKTWKREFERWWPGTECSIVRGTAAERRKALTDDNPVKIINWETLRSHSRLSPYGSIALKRCRDCGGQDAAITHTTCETHVRELNEIDFATVIADEVHRAKEPKSKQTRALWAATGDAPIRIGLSGTPIANNVIDLWAPLHWLNPAEWPSKTKWVDRYVNTMMNAFGGTMVLGLKQERYEEFYAGINPHTRRMPKELVLPFLPPIIFTRRYLEMNTRQAKVYKQMRDTLVAELDGGMLIAGTPLTKAGRLAQLASSFAEVKFITEVDEHGREYDRPVVTLKDPSNKIDAFMDDIPDFDGESVAVMAVSRQLIDLLSARLTKAKIPHGLITGAVDEDERQRHIDEFQAGKTKFILFTAAAGGVGITLTAARYLVRLQRPWSRVDDVQALNRVHRIGSDRHESIIVIDYISESTVEENVLKILDKKGAYFEEVVRDADLLRRALRDDFELE